MEIDDGVQPFIKAMNNHDQEQTMEALKKGKCLRNVNCCYASYFLPSAYFIIVIQTALRSVEDEEQEERQIRDIESGQYFHDAILLQCKTVQGHIRLCYFFSVRFYTSLLKKLFVLILYSLQLKLISDWGGGG